MNLDGVSSRVDLMPICTVKVNALLNIAFWSSPCTEVRKRSGCHNPYDVLLCFNICVYVLSSCVSLFCSPPVIHCELVGVHYIMPGVEVRHLPYNLKRLHGLIYAILLCLHKTFSQERNNRIYSTFNYEISFSLHATVPTFLISSRKSAILRHSEKIYQSSAIYRQNFHFGRNDRRQTYCSHISYHSNLPNTLTILSYLLKWV